MPARAPAPWVGELAALLDPRQLKSIALSLWRPFAVTLAAALALVGAVMLLAGSDGLGGVLQWPLNSWLALAAAVRGPVVLGYDVAGLASVASTLTVTAMTTTLSALLLWLLYRDSRRAERATPSGGSWQSLAALSLATGFFTALVVAVVAAVMRPSSRSDVSDISTAAVTYSGAFWRTLLWGTLLLTVAVAAGRLAGRLGVDGPPWVKAARTWLAGWQPDLRLLRTQLLLGAVVALVVGLGLLLRVADDDVSDTATSLAAALLVLPTVALAGLAVSMGMNVVVAYGNFDDSLGLLSGDLRWWYYLSPLIPLLATAVAGAREGLRNPEGGRWPSWWWRVPVLSLLFWVLFAVLSRISVSYAVRGDFLGSRTSDDGGYAVGLGAFSLVFFAVLWGLLAVAAQTFLPGPVARAMPGVAVRLRGVAPAASPGAPDAGAGSAGPPASGSFLAADPAPAGPSAHPYTGQPGPAGFAPQPAPTGDAVLAGPHSAAPPVQGQPPQPLQGSPFQGPPFQGPPQFQPPFQGSPSQGPPQFQQPFQQPFQQHFQAPPPGAFQPPAESRPVSPEARRRRRRLLLLGLGAAAVLVLAAIAFALLGSRAASPERAVADVFTAVNEGDVALLERRVSDWPSDSPLLTAEALRATHRDSSALADVRTRELAGGTDTSRRVEVTYRVGGDEQKETLLLTRSDERRLGFRTWDVTGLIGSVRTSQPSAFGGTSSGYRVAGVDRPLFGETDAAPGAYSVSLEETGMFTADPRTVTVAPDAEVSAELTPRVSDVGRQRILTELDAYLERCRASRSAFPVGCPFRLLTVAGEDVSWTLDRKPSETAQIELRPVFGDVVVRGDLLAAASFSTTDFDGGTSRENQTVDASYLLRATFAGDTVTLAPTF